MQNILSPFAMNRFLCTMVFSISALALQAQSAQVKGRVVDIETNESLPFANVFLDRSTIGTAADGDGYFILEIPMESTELLFSFVGYRLGKVNLKLKTGENNLGAIGLVPAEQQLSDVEVKASRDKTWEKQLAKFEKIFLGDDAIAVGCKILNPWVLEFSDKEKGKQLIAKADVPLEIENNSLGYKMQFYLNDFWKNAQGYLIDGKVRFEQMPITNDEVTKQWLSNRERAYVGSVQHFFKSIITKRIGGEKFKLYTERPGLENATARSLLFSESFSDALMEYDTTGMVQLVMDRGLYEVRMPGRVEVHNYNERSMPRVYRDMGYEVSWITLASDVVMVNEEGFPINPTDVITAGAMSDQRISYLLPQDYQKGKIETKEDLVVSFQRFREKVYLHTDKPYYYPGEPVWFAAYMNYGDPILQDSMSKVLYVDLISPQREIIQSRALVIKNGKANGDFILDNTILAGTYYLRAYTNWSRNFEDGMFVKAFALVNMTDKIDPSQRVYEKYENEELVIVSDKDVYRTREKITVSIMTTTPVSDPISANLSISVTDMNQVVPVSEKHITDSFALSGKSDPLYEKLHPVEYGLTVHGKFINGKGEREQTVLDVMQLDPYAFYLTEASADGQFTLAGLQGYDSVDLYFKPSKAKVKSFGKIEIEPRIVPVGEEARGIVELKSMVTEFPQRIISDYEVPRDARVLEEVEIRSTRIDEEAVQRYAESYGKSNYVLEEKYINKSYGNLLYTLNGQLPGLVVRETNSPEGFKWVIYTERAKASSLGSPPPPLIMVNNVAMVGDPANIIGAIDPNTVTRIELTTRINTLHGSRGAGGVLAIYTKTGAEIADKPIDPNFQSVKIPGYYKPRSFRSPDYESDSTDKSKGDYRATLSWNPFVITDQETGKTSLTFFAADLETTYRVVVEGVTAENKPVRNEYYIEVRND